MKVSVVSNGGVWRSVHLSGKDHGFTHVAALVGTASAVAPAPMSIVFTPKIEATRVGTALPRAAVRKTSTWMRVGWPAGSSGKVMSLLSTEGVCPMIGFAIAVFC